MKKLLVAVAATLAVGAGTVGTANAAHGSIAEIAAENGSFDTLLAAAAAAGLADELDNCDYGPITVFAPVDEAFAGLPAGTVDALLADIPALTDILLYHVIPGVVLSTDAVLLTEATMANGDKVTITVTPEPLSVTLNKGLPGEANVNLSLIDIEACNGVIHVIDAVLLPPAAEEPEVPATGSNSTIALLGGALIAIGALFTAATRRRTVTA